MEGKLRKWIISAIGLIVIGTCTYVSLPKIYNIMRAQFDQTVLLNKLSSKLSRFRISEVGVGEIFLVSYAYDDQ